MFNCAAHGKKKDCARGSSPRLIFLRDFFVPIALGGILYATPSAAAGTTAGSQIESTATATFTSGTFSGSVSSNTISLRVDELVDLAVSAPSAPTVLAGGEPVALPFVLANVGNGPEAFRVSALATIAGNGFDVTVEQIALDSNGNGLFDAGIDQVLPLGSDTPSLGADNSLTVFVLVRLPTGASDGQTSSLRLTATAVTGTGQPGSVRQGAGVGGTDAVIGLSGGESYANAALIAKLAGITLTKAAAIRDPFGGSQPVPGATVTYQLTANVLGSGQVQNLVVSDTIPAGTSYLPGSLKLDDAPLSDAADSDAGIAAADGITVKILSADGGSTHVVSFDVKIN